MLTALIPLLAAVYLANIALTTTAERFFRPEIGARLDESLSLYQELARAQKTAMRAQAAAIAARPGLAEAAKARDAERVKSALAAAKAESTDVVSLSVEDDGAVLASVDRGRPPDEAREVTLVVRRSLVPGAREPEGPAPGRDDDRAELDHEDDQPLGPTLVATFSADKTIYDGRDRLSDFVETYGKIAGRRKADERTYLVSFAVLLGVTITFAIAVGVLLARSVSMRIERLADATRKVGAGDLTTRVAESGADEVSDLARAFNRMLADMESNRARIEYLQRIGAWQEMARRLAHEIKNPLTPIQLAVEEVHQRYAGGDAAFQKALDAMLEVVQAEVGTLRRLVGEFSSFARMPRAVLATGDLSEFLRDQSAQSLLGDQEEAERPLPTLAVSIHALGAEAPAAFDRQMLRLTLVNLVRNSAHAIRDQGRANGRVEVRLGRSGDYFTLDVDDDGPGIPEDLRDRMFDPYVTTKDDGTGLGLAIVKKVVVEHGGVVTPGASPLGGARMRLTIPALGTIAGQAALAASEAPPPPSSPLSKVPPLE